MDARERLKDAGKQPGAYGLRTFGEAVAFVIGMDAGSEWQLLGGFRSWLMKKHAVRQGGGLMWPVLVTAIAYPERDTDDWVGLLDGPSPEAFHVMFREIDAFLSR